MGPVKWLTPELVFLKRNTEKKPTARPPLSYYLRHDVETALDKGCARGNYGIYLVDAFGNKVIYTTTSPANPIPADPDRRRRRVRFDRAGSGNQPGPSRQPSRPGFGTGGNGGGDQRVRQLQAMA